MKIVKEAISTPIAESDQAVSIALSQVFWASIHCPVESLENEQSQNKTKNKIHKGAVISIQSLTIGDLVPMQAEAINDMIYQLIKSSGMENVVDPNQYRPDTVYTIKEADSLNSALTSMAS